MKTTRSAAKSATRKRSRMVELNSAISVFKTGNVLFVKSAERYLEESQPFLPSHNAVCHAALAEIIVARLRLKVPAVDRDGAGAFEHAPKFVSVRMRLQRDRFSRLHTHDFHRRRLVQREALETSPRAIFLHIVREAFHGLILTQKIKTRW